MTVTWSDVLHKLRSYPVGVHRIRPPCPDFRIELVERQLGKLPTELSDMLKQFNGVSLFNKGAGGEMLDLFGVSEEPAPEWGVDWYIDKFTPKWRAAGTSRQDDWAIAMMNYGGLILLDGQGTVREWDTSQQEWSPGRFSFDQWLDEIFREGEAYLREE